MSYEEYKNLKIISETSDKKYEDKIILVEATECTREKVEDNYFLFTVCKTVTKERTIRAIKPVSTYAFRECESGYIIRELESLYIVTKSLEILKHETNQQV